MRQSKVLIITICSNEKNKGGDVYKLESPSIVKILPEHSDGIIQRRLKALELIQSGPTGRDGLPVNELPFNSSLRLGPEFGPRNPAVALYKPALDRYAGRFFTALKGEKEVQEILEESSHHLLIFSSLYGLVLPDELIQCYSCNLEDHPEVASIWTDNGFLTSIVLAYIRRFNIDTVFDLTAQDAYRSLLDWERMDKKANVLHVFGEQLVGPALLFALGELAREHLLFESEEVLKSIEPNEKKFLDKDTLIFTKEPFPPPGFPREEKMKPLENSAVENQIEIQNSETQEMGDVSRTEEGKAGILVLDHSRDIRVTSKDHNTIFEKKIKSLDDLPAELRNIIKVLSRCPDVLEIFLGKRKKSGQGANAFKFRLLGTQKGSGYIEAKVEGSGQVCHTQDVRIRVTKGHEEEVFNVLRNLLDQKI